MNKRYSLILVINLSYENYIEDAIIYVEKVSSHDLKINTSAAVAPKD